MRYREMNESEPPMTRRKHREDLKSEIVMLSGNSTASTHVLAVRGPALRWHEPVLGERMERENLRSQCQEKRTSLTRMSLKVSKWGQEADWFVVAMKATKAAGAKEPGHFVTRENQPKGRSSCG